MSNKYGADKLAILAFPSDEFGGQELKTCGEIEAFTTKAGVDAAKGFHMMEKVQVNGPSASSVWQYLKGSCDSCGADVRWNFAAQFVVDQNGKTVKRVSDAGDAADVVASLM
mmetsp:Transcript_15394/g.38939  ORF Transcript_15394/g.38939 Transcript_15394/m.38939 type:complete len:112 (+) Transcript_15394:268-603(+)